MSSVLITGGAGYVGSHIVLNLLKRNYKVLVFDSFVNSKENILDTFNKAFDQEFLKENLTLIKGDLRYREHLLDLFMSIYEKGQEIEFVIHCAGLKSVKESSKDSLNYWEVNVGGTINLLQIMNKFDCKKIIFSSSATVYDFSDSEFLNEQSKLKPINPYGNTKFVIEKLLEDTYLSSKNEWKIINLRYFNPIGANSEGMLGESPTSGRDNIFPLILDVASRKIEKITIFGDDWNTRDGTCVRDYIHIDDLADCHIRALEYLAEESQNFLNLNIGTGKGTTVLELVKTFEKTNDVIVPYVIGKRRSGDFGSVVADNTLATNLLNWTPRKDLEDMCKDGWEWFLNSQS